MDRSAGRIGKWSQTDNQATDIDLTHITAALNRLSLISAPDKHSLKQNKGSQEVNQSSHNVTS